MKSVPAGAITSVPRLCVPRLCGRLLVVEDNYVNQQLMQRVLTRDGFEVVIASDGNEAIICASQQPFDAVLMDCQMRRSTATKPRGC